MRVDAVQRRSDVVRAEQRLDELASVHSPERAVHVVLVADDVRDPQNGLLCGLRSGCDDIDPLRPGPLPGRLAMFEHGVKQEPPGFPSTSDRRTLNTDHRVDRHEKPGKVPLEHSCPIRDVTPPPVNHAETVQLDVGQRRRHVPVGAGPKQRPTRHPGRRDRAGHRNALAVIAVRHPCTDDADDANRAARSTPDKWMYCIVVAGLR